MRPKAEPVVIGVTGGIGAGKSSVLSYLKHHTMSRVIQADIVGRELMEPGKSVHQALVSAYGKKILKEDGAIDKQALAKIGFSSEEERLKLNALEHGLIKEEIIKRIGRTRLPVVFVEAALLKEGHLIPICSKVLYIYADPESRISRLMKSRGYSREKCERFLSMQLSDRAFRQDADEVIDNSGAFENTEKALKALIKRLHLPERKA